VLAVGIVVDDAIVVVENVERNIRSGMSPQEAAHRTMDEVGGALISIALRSFGSSWWSSMTKENQIRRAWEGFVENGAVSVGLRGVIADSWQRSQEHGIPVERKGAPLALEPELLQRYSAHSTLVSAALPALRQARLFLAEANSMIILTDPSGLILETAGDPRTIDFGHLVHLGQGGRWKEADIGTNAIGTAIAVSEPVQIHGVEHFCSEVGVLDLCGYPDLASKRR
jgi:transcriptional regulator of acetoin/glycerol metabolism